MTDNKQYILNLLNWNGSWALRSFFDDAIYKHLTNQKHDFDFAKIIIQNSSGKSAKRYMNKYSELTGFSNSDNICDELTENTNHIIDLQHLDNIPYEISSDFWLEKLCNHLDTNRHKLTTIIAEQQRNESKTEYDLKTLIINWSFPIIAKFCKINNYSIDFDIIDSDINGLCWKKWYSINDKIVLIDSIKNEIINSKKVVWSLIHDAAHIFHLLNFSKELNYLNPVDLLQMESFAMLTEFNFLNSIDFQNIPNELNTNSFDIKTNLLLGFVERALRIDFDFNVHFRKMKIEKWFEISERKTGLKRNLFDFANEFHGMPGFCAGYMLGLYAIKKETSLIAILEGTKKLDFLNFQKKDSFSTSPLTDIPAKKTQHGIYIQSVGATDTLCQFTLYNPFNKKYELILGKAEITVGLSPDQRGIHMSRLQQIITNIDSEIQWKTINDLSKHLSINAMEIQKSNRAETTISMDSFVETFNIISNTQSKQPINIIANTNILEKSIIQSLTVSLKVMTSCPCTLQYSRLITEQNLKSIPNFEFTIGFMDLIPPTFTHSQPGLLTVKITSENELAPIENIYEQIKSVAHLVESVLKRPDEHFLVNKSHCKPQFSEDLCREVAVAVASILNQEDTIEVTTELDESIHPHKAYAKLSSKASNLWYSN